MKTIFTSIILLVTFNLVGISNAKAQFVTINDTSFVAWLTNHYPNCMSGNLMDTTCIDITTETVIEFVEPTFTIQSIYGLEYFDSAKVFKLNNFANNGTLQYIDKFPPNLTKLNLVGAYLSDLPSLPPSIDSLVLNGNNFGYNLFDLIFPPSLKYLLLAGCQLQALPALPEGLIELQVQSNPNLGQNFTIPSTVKILNFNGCNTNGMPVLPPNLILLDISNNNIGSSVFSIQTLPSTLKYFYCSGNSFTFLPEFSNELELLNCGFNLLDSLPNLPPNIFFLNCKNNSIDTLLLPPIVQFLDCSNNQLNYIQGNNYLNYLECSNNNLSQLPNTSSSLYYLFFSNNQVTCLPELDPYFFSQQGSEYFNADNNPIYCVPNYVPAMGATFIANHPLCIMGDSINNPNNCDYARNLIGRTYKDNDDDCVYNYLDSDLQNIKVNLYNPLNNEFSSAFSFLGLYNIPLEIGNYMVSVDTSFLPYTSVCEYPGLDTIVSITALDPIAEDVNFAIKCKDGQDLEVRNMVITNGLVFPGQQHKVRLYVGDMSQYYGLNCSNNVSGTITIEYTGPVTFVSSQYNVLPTISGDTLTFDISNFGSVSSFIDLNFITDTTAQANELVCLNVSVASPTIENRYDNNNATYCYNTVNSYDPNIKMVYPKDVQPGYDDWLTYTIYFQNLGNAPAFNIRILDTLDNNLNLETFQIVGFSHANNATLNNGILTFRFPNIMLPDSASNPEGSIGFIQYRIKPISNLPVGAQIVNTAHIYFDFNPAIVTNTTVNEYVTTVTASAKKIENDLIISPNPSNGVFYFGSNTKVKSLEVFDCVGNTIMQKSNVNNFDLSDFSNGIYFVRVNGNQYSKVIKN